MRLTLNRLLGAAVAVMALLLAFVFVLIDAGLKEAATQSAEDQRALATAKVSDKVSDYLSQGEAVVHRLELRMQQGLCLGRRTESCVMAELLGNENLAEVTFTEGKELGYSESGQTLTVPESRRLLSVYRARPGPDSEVCSREVTPSGEEDVPADPDAAEAAGPPAKRPTFAAKVTCRSPYDVLGGPHPSKTDAAVDPTTSGQAFRMPASQRIREEGKTLFSDLSYSTLDDTLPEARRRVVVLFLKAVEDAQHHLVGVLKAGLTEDQLRTLMLEARVNNAQDDGFRIFIADNTGRLVTALSTEDKLIEDNDDLRFVARQLPPEVRASLDSPALREAVPGKNTVGAFEVAGRQYHVTFHALLNTWGWALAVVGPDDFYLRSLEAARRRTLMGLICALSVIFGAAFLLIRSVQRAFAQIQSETTAMQAFEFKAHTPNTPFGDVRDTLESLERAKTAVRAMGKYVPLALVHTLFQSNREPTLGGNPREVTLMFTDIEGFTSRAEKDPPDVVANWLGRYLAVMAQTVQSERGTVDKFIGDAVMAIWNAPHDIPEHSVQACRAALRCEAALEKLYQSAEWEGRQPLVTRFGLHVGGVFIGHFGSPDRLSYTAIGDSVNLAARLESLNKQYGTRLLASEDVVQRAGGHFAFRLIDRVAVKGKSQAIGVYELMGPKEAPRVAPAVVSRYAEALAAYTQGDFSTAQKLFLENAADPPSVAMARRCAAFIANPPLPPWTGITVAHEK